MAEKRPTYAGSIKNTGAQVVKVPPWRRQPEGQEHGQDRDRPEKRQAQVSTAYRQHIAGKA